MQSVGLYCLSPVVSRARCLQAAVQASARSSTSSVSCFVRADILCSTWRTPGFGGREVLKNRPRRAPCTRVRHPLPDVAQHGPPHFSCEGVVGGQGGGEPPVGGGGTPLAIAWVARRPQ